MFKLNLVISRKGDDVMIFSPPPWFRVFFLIISVIMISGIVLNISEGGERISIIAVVISLICIVASMYEESWTFNLQSRLIIFKTGLIFLNKETAISFDDVGSLSVSVVQRGGRSKNKQRRISHPRYNQELLLNLKSGECKTIENFDGYNTDTFSQKAAILAGFCGFSLTA